MTGYVSWDSSDRRGVARSDGTSRSIVAYMLPASVSI